MITSFSDCGRLRGVGHVFVPRWTSASYLIIASATDPSVFERLCFQLLAEIPRPLVSVSSRGAYRDKYTCGDKRQKRAGKAGGQLQIHVFDPTEQFSNRNVNS